MSDTDDVARAQDGPAAPRAHGPRRRLVLKLGIAAALAVIAVALVLPVFSTLQPGYYERYPALRERMRDWRASTHARVSCAACHVPSGVIGFLGFAARSVPAFYSQLIQGPRATNLLGVPSRQACQECHTRYREVSPNGDLLIPHRAHVEVLQVNCATCHKDLVHAPNRLGFNKPAMSMCLGTCHDGGQATDRCVKCHTRKQVPDSHRAPGWLQVHGAKAATTNCGTCHGWSPDYCRTCHLKRPRSHAGNWKSGHAAVARARGTKGCMFCHRDRAFCRRCHD